MAERLEVDGSCHCGQITYSARVDPSSVSICHCTDCQALTGSAFRVTVSARREDVFLTAGEPAVYIKTEKAAKDDISISVRAVARRPT